MSNLIMSPQTEPKSTQYYITKVVDVNGSEKYSPASPLDNFLMLKNTKKKYIIKFHDFLTGNVLNNDVSLDKFLESVINNNTNNVHQSTDHLMYSITTYEDAYDQNSGVNLVPLEEGATLLEAFTCFYVSLENSVRSITNDCPLITKLNESEKDVPPSRLDNICDALNNMTKQYHNEFVVFFSESCRSSFHGSIGDRKYEMTWLEIMRRIALNTNLTCMAQKRNNEDPSGLSFGISAWISLNAERHIDNFFCESILDIDPETKSFGSGVIGIRLKSGTIMWVVHFPIDFFNNRESKKNKAHISMVNLQKLMDSYPGSFCAFGDMNTIEGLQNDTIRDAINNEKYELLLNNVTTFFGSNFDLVDPSRDPYIEWEPIKEYSSEKKYIFTNIV